MCTYMYLCAVSDVIHVHLYMFRYICNIYIHICMKSRTNIHTYVFICYQCCVAVWSIRRLQLQLGVYVHLPESVLKANAALHRN